LSQKEVMEIDNRQIHLTNLDRLLWPDNNITKFDLIKYYIKIFPFIFPHLEQRPLSLKRFPRGINSQGFFQKNCPDWAPSWIKTTAISSGSRAATRFILVDHPATLVWLANQSCIEIHPWLSKISSLGKPDFAVFDLDPMPGVHFNLVIKTALEIKNLLEKFNLKGYPKLSGSSGLQIFLPLVPIYDYKQVRDFAHKFLKQINTELPQITTMERKVKKRGKKVYLDYLQNVKGKTIASVYGPRPFPQAPVSAPLTWKELKKNLSPKMFTMENILPRLEKKGDLFLDVLKNKQKLQFP